MKFGKWTAGCLLAGFLALGGTGDLLAYDIEFSYYGLINPSTMQPCTGRDDTSPFDAEFRRTGRGQGETEIIMADMDGGYRGCRIYFWKMTERDANGDNRIDPQNEATWSYQGGFTATVTGIRAISIMNRDEFMVLHGNGTVAVYPRDYNTLGISPNTPVSQVRPTPLYTFSIGTPHHSAYDPEDKILWTNQGTGVANGYDADPDSETFGQRIKRIQFPINYIEGIAFRFDVCAQQKRLYFYNGPGSSTQGQIWIYNVSTTSSEGDGAFIERTPYESGDLPPFHSECLSWDGAHFWMCGYTDGKVYRMTELVDSDCDGTTDGADNCPNVPNPEQGDRDLDGVGDLCDCQPDNDAEPGDDGVCQPTCVGGVSAVTTETEHYRITGLLLGLLPIVSLLLWRRRRA